MTDTERKELREWSAETVMGWERVYAEGLPMWKFPSKRWDSVKWTPDTDLNQTFMVVERMRELDYYIEINFDKKYGIEVEISYGENHPYYPKSNCRESGDERIALIEVKTIEELGGAILLAAKATGVK
jgi:hypothetical protein